MIIVFYSTRNGRSSWRVPRHLLKSASIELPPRKSTRLSRGVTEREVRWRTHRRRSEAWPLREARASRSTGCRHRYRHADANALEDVSFTIEPGECVALIGRSGCGKSTLLAHPRRARAPLGRGSPDRRRSRLGAVAPLGNDVPAAFAFPWLSVAGNVSLGFWFAGRTREAPSRVVRTSETCRIERFRGPQRAGSFRRPAAARGARPLAGAFAGRAASRRAVLVARRLHEQLASARRPPIARELGVTLIVVTHDINEAAIMADRAFIMTSRAGTYSRTDRRSSADRRRGRKQGFEQAPARAHGSLRRRSRSCLCRRRCRLGAFNEIRIWEGMRE